MPQPLSKILCLNDFEAQARSFLPKPIFTYIQSATETNASLQDNENAFSAWGFVPRIMRDVSQRTSSTTLFGETYAAPFGLAPMGISALSAYRGDLVLAKAAQTGNIPMIMSGSSLIPMEEVQAAAPKSWFQAYIPGDEARILALIERVKHAGFQTLVVTVDTAIISSRENNVRAGFSTPLRPSSNLLWQGLTHPRWSFGTFLKTIYKHGIPHFENSFAERGVPIIARDVERDFSKRDHLNWEHFKLIRKNWQGNLLIKGILSLEDAVLAQNYGADGIILSNHGGRQLDGAVSALRVLPLTKNKLKNTPLILDGGIRRGTDILKALALGANFVLVGRPFNYAASVYGEQGVNHAIGLLKKELNINMALLGINTLEEMTQEKLMALRL